MANIRDFNPGTSEERGVITVSRYSDPADQAPAFNYNHDGFWRFSIPVAHQIDGKPIWIRLHADAINTHGQDGAILDVAAAELLAIARANAAPDATLPDGRKVTDLKPADLYQ
jgi:hypothetical protein